MEAELAQTGATPRVRRFSAMDWVSIALLTAGLLATISGILPPQEALTTVSRIAPLLAFLGSVIVLAELTTKADVFDVIATRITLFARGRNAALFFCCVPLASAVTIFLNLDTTAVLLTPVMLSAAERAGVARLPLAVTTVWLANGASLLLPVSNLTNLLAADRVAMHPLAFAARMLAPQCAVLVVLGACLWVFYWRNNGNRFAAPEPFKVRDRWLFLTAATSCVLFMIGVIAGLPLWTTSLVCALIVAVAFAHRDVRQLHWGLLPWRLIVFVTGLFLVVDTISLNGLNNVMRWLIGSNSGALGTWRASATGGVLSNLINNLPIYKAGEGVIPLANEEQLLGLLIGTNVAPLVTPWASLATLLWAERCRSAGVSIPWGRLVATSFVAALLSLVVGVSALIVTAH